MTRNTVEREIIDTLSSILGRDRDDQLHVDDSLLEQGADSLALMKCVEFIADRYGLEIPYKQFYLEIKSIGDLVSYIDGNSRKDNSAAPLEVDRFASTRQALRTDKDVREPSAPDVDGVWLETLLRSQIELMGKHLDLVGRMRTPSRTESRSVAAPLRGQADTQSRKTLPATDAGAVDRFNAFTTRAREAAPANDAQLAYLREFSPLYTSARQRSKVATQQYRRVLADNRASAGFRPQTKELLFPILGDRAKGAYLWDIDDNRYVDITMGFGVHLLGHNPEPINRRLADQLSMGMPIGPQSPIAGRVAQLIGELTGHDRIAFCNSGTEATMTAVRLARAHTGKPKIAIFRESYHGTFDGFIARRAGSAGGEATPASPGVPPSSVADTLVLEYGDDEALALIEENADQLAAVLVEPVQSRRPALQPREFLKELRRITAARGIVYVWDEVITGFRIGPGGAQEYFGVQADIGIYGKVVGGGMPIGLVAGKAEILDLIDGGYWTYGDDSLPPSAQIFFAGTFSKHPLTMAASLATLELIKERKEELYPLLNRKTAGLADATNRLFDEEGVDIRVERFGSLFRYVSRKNIDLFFAHLVRHGVYIWEGRNCFLSTAHSDADIAFLLEATKASIAQLKAGAFIDSTGKRKTESTRRTIWQRRLCNLWQDPSTTLAVNIGGGVLFSKAPDIDRLEEAIMTALGGCQTLQASFDQKSQSWCLANHTLRVERHEVQDRRFALLEEEAAAWVRQEHHRAFLLTDTLQCRVQLVRFRNDGVLLAMTVNHCVCDGFSFGLALETIISNYLGASKRRLGDSLAAAVALEERYVGTTKYATDRDFWTSALTTYNGEDYASRIVEGPAHSCHRKTYTVAADISALVRRHKTTPYILFLTAFNLALYGSRLAQLGVIGVPVLNRDGVSGDNEFGQFTTIFPMSSVRKSITEADALVHTRDALLDILSHGKFPIDPRGNDGLNAPPIAVSVNMEPSDLDLSEEMGAAIIYGERADIEFPLAGC
jgi:glutamate-1-semialdehyde aminotransferase/acyl carrier protein